MAVAKARSKAKRRRPFKPKRGRPDAKQAVAISRSIMEAATEVFLAEGFDGASMEMIATKARVPKSTLYKRYGDKLGLVRAVIETRVAQWDELATQYDWGDRKLEERLTVCVASLLLGGLSPEISSFSRLAQSAWPDDAARRMEVLGMSRMIDAVERDIRECGPKEGVRAKDPRQVAEVLMALTTGWLEMRSTPNNAEATAFAKSAVAMMLHGNSAW